jgi:hypothetical protein
VAAIDAGGANAHVSLPGAWSLSPGAPPVPQMLKFLEAFRDKTLKRISDTDQAVNDLVFEVKVRTPHTGWVCATRA